MTDHLLVDDGIPLRTMMFSEDFYADLDPGIRFPVRVLHANGVETCQSCQGGDGHSYDRPTIEMAASTSYGTDGFPAVHYLHQFGLPIADVGLIWRIEHGLPFDAVWRVTFTKSMEDRADDGVMFVWGYQAQQLRRSDGA